MSAGVSMLGGNRAWCDIWIRSGWRVQQGASEDATRLLTPAGRIAVKGSLSLCLAAARAMAPTAHRPRAAILLHGLGRGGWIMWRLERALAGAGWAVANVEYPSMRQPAERNAAAVRLVARGMQENGAREVALIGHSLGGLIARMAAAHAAADGWPLGRLVLIGSPARGSAVADVLKNFAPFRIIYGDGGLAVTRLRAGAVPVPATEIAVIAGGNGGKGYNPFLDGDNDGIVTVAETRMPGAETDFLILPSIHATLPMRRTTIEATLRFLETGRLVTGPL